MSALSELKARVEKLEAGLLVEGFFKGNPSKKHLGKGFRHSDKGLKSLIPDGTESDPIQKQIEQLRKQIYSLKIKRKAADAKKSGKIFKSTRHLNRFDPSEPQ